jgi:hypothetical protein
MASNELPPPDVPITVDVFDARWPTGAEKAELVDGVIVFYGGFGEPDARAARLVYPGRRVVLNADGGIEVHPAGPPHGIWASLER